MDNTVIAAMKADLTEELAIVRALLAEQGRPALTEEILTEAAHQGAVFAVGEMVRVLNAFRLPSVEEQIGSGVIRRITVSAGEAIYWVDGFACGRSARVLRPMEAL